MQRERRRVGRCQCGTSLDIDVRGEDGQCNECVRQRYEEVWSQRISPEFTQFKALLFGSILLLISCIPAYAEPSVDMKALCMVESGCRALAIGDHGKALGMWQIHKEVVEDWNRYADLSGDAYYSHDEMLEPNKAEIVARWYVSVQIPAYLRVLLRSNKPITRDQVLTAFNMGVKAVKEGKTAKEYIKKYEEALHANNL